MGFESGFELVALENELPNLIRFGIMSHRAPVG